MNCFQRLFLLTVVLATSLSSCAATFTTSGATASVRAPAQVAHKGLLPTPSASLDLNVASMSLDELLHRVSTVTGVTFSPNGTAGDQLKKTNVALSQDKKLAAAEIYPWVESIVEQNGFMFAILEGGDAPLIGVYWNRGPNPNPPAYHIEADQIAECRMHPAFMFMTVMTLPHTDVRSLGNSLRVLSPDTQSGGVVPVGMTNSVILTGSGRWLADIAAMLETIDAKAAQSAAAPKNP